MRLLVTGFEPFGEHERNISKLIVEDLDRRLIIQDPYGLQEGIDCVIETQVLSVDEAGSRLIADSSEEYDFILHLGLCETCEVARVESTAHNELDFRIADNSGRVVSSEEIITGGNDLQTSIPIDSWRLNSKIELSKDAGRFLCNETYYRTLKTKGGSVLFLHIPNISLDKAKEIVLDVISMMVHPPVVEVAAGLIRNHEGELLALRRSQDVPHSGKWEIPGGRIEESEDSASALKRELKEELSIEVEVGSYLGVWEESSKVRLRLHVHEVSTNQSPILSVHDKMQWGGILVELDWLDIDRRILSQLNAM